MADHLLAEPARDALTLARRVRRPGVGRVHHTDRGSQYTAAAYQATRADRAVTVSRHRAGACRDNAVAERCCATSKAELVDTKVEPTLAAARPGQLRIHRGVPQPPAPPRHPLDT